MSVINLNRPPLMLADKKLSEAEVRARLADRFPATEATVDPEDRQRLIAQVAAGIAMHTDDQAEARYHAAVEAANEPEAQRPAPWHMTDASAAIGSLLVAAVVGIAWVLLA